MLRSPIFFSLRLSSLTPTSRIMAGICLLIVINVIPLNEARAEPLNLKEPKQIVADVELAFAQTMAQRDFETFKTFIADDAIFFSATKALRGKAEIVAAWEAYFKEPQAPFSWLPDQVEVLESGTLALSSGPVHDAAGKRVGTFNSVWQMDDTHHWRVIFDKGSPYCDTQTP